MLLNTLVRAFLSTHSGSDRVSCKHSVHTEVLADVSQEGECVETRVEVDIVDVAEVREMERLRAELLVIVLGV